MSSPIKVNTNTIELIVQTSCYCVLDLLCVTWSSGLEPLAQNNYYKADKGQGLRSRKLFFTSSLPLSQEQGNYTLSYPYLLLSLLSFLLHTKRHHDKAC